MHNFSSIVARCLLAAWPFLSTDGAKAAVIKGRVVDSAGKPVAGAEVRIWQKLEENMWGVSDHPVKFDGGEALFTDADGRFSTPDALVGESFAWIVVEAHGMLAGRSGWIEIGKDDTAAPDIVMRRLRAVIGQVHDSRGQPVAGATVFNAGDGHERVETKTGRNGKFFLDGVPEGDAFLFAEKPGYRFTGMRLSDGESSAALTLTSIQEAAEPLATLPPLLSAEEETALARRTLDLWLTRAPKPKTELQKLFAIGALSQFDPLAALGRLAVSDQRYRARSRQGLIEMLAARSDQISPDNLRQLIDNDDNQFAMASECLAAARYLDGGPRSPKFDWLDEALRHARTIDDPAQRAIALALAAEALFSRSHRERAETVLAEAEKSAETLPDGYYSTHALGLLALAAAKSDAERAVEWLEKIKSDRDYQQRGAQVAIRLLPGRPELAEEVWNRAGPRRPHRPSARSAYLADFCYRVAALNRSSAERTANAAQNSALRIRGKGAIALALAEAQPAEARRLLESLVRELADAAIDGDPRMRSWSPPTTAAWLLPIAEQVAPDLCREIFWRSLALRLPRPRREPFDDEVETTDLELVKMLARYDRAVARALLAPLAARLPQLASVAATGLTSRQALLASANVTQPIREIVVAAVHVDAHWARTLLDELPLDSAASKVYAPEGAWQAFIIVLANYHGPRRWQEGNGFCAAFWAPRSDEEIKR